MSDLISRQAVLDALKAIPDHNDGMVFETLSHALRDIELLPSAQPEWIPCKERLPEEDRNVLVSVHFLGLEIKHKTGWTDHIKGSWYVDVACQIGGEWTSASDEYKVAKNRHIVTAWMPLPMPWRGEEG